MIFRKGGRVNRNIRFIYKGHVLEIVSKFTYLGIVFTTGGSVNTFFEMLAGQALKAIFKLKSNLLKFLGITVQHKLDLFDKLILPILNYGSEVWGLNDSTKLEGIHNIICKHILAFRGQTQNNFVYGELGRTSLKSRRVVNVIKYWLKSVQLDITKFASLMYRTLDNNPTHMSWARHVKTLG